MGYIYTLKNCVKHTVSGLKDVNYLEVWAKLLTNKSVKEDCSVVLHVIELLLITPFTNAKVERMFSQMNRVKTDWRSSLLARTFRSFVANRRRRCSVDRV